MNEFDNEFANIPQGDLHPRTVDYYNIERDYLETIGIEIQNSQDLAWLNVGGYFDKPRDIFGK
ncbi:MAG: hypothetical protein KatS3mg087_0565 [Patescibacteria group bacterium]|nr:MAG: hypothetical protein KatS3mg087_0565 [Patescibacteria group bacterium]